MRRVTLFSTTMLQLMRWSNGNISFQPLYVLQCGVLAVVNFTAVPFNEISWDIEIIDDNRTNANYREEGGRMKLGIYTPGTLSTCVCCLILIGYR